MYVLGCGSRTWTDWGSVRDALIWLPEDAVIVHGDQRGADMCFDIEATKLGLRVRRFPAEWDRLGPAAGPARNSVMLEVMKKARRAGHELLVLAFHDDRGLGTGTRDMVKKALAAKMEVLVFLAPSAFG